MPSQSVTYEQILLELQALLGQVVTVSVEVEISRHRQPLALFLGVLIRGQDVDLSPEFPVRTSAPPGESVWFVVAGKTQLPLCTFVVTEQTCKLGEKHDDGALTFRAGKAFVAVIPEPSVTEAP